MSNKRKLDSGDVVISIKKPRTNSSSMARYSYRRPYYRPYRRPYRPVYVRPYRRPQRAYPKRFPKSEYGRMFMKRGTNENIHRFGIDAKLANPGQLAARKEVGYAGRGSYLGKMLNSGLGQQIVRSGKHFAMDALKNYTGSGLYEGQGSYDESPVTNHLIGGDPIAKFSSPGDETGTVSITRTEFVSDIYAPNSSSLSFKNTAYPLNPGIERSFPWLAQLASNFEEYRFAQLMYEYRSMTTESTSSASSGTVIMATNYNAVSPSFEEKSTMMEYEGSMSSKITQSMRHGVECDDTKLSGSSGHYVRSNPVSNGQDARILDHGTFQIAVANIPLEYADLAIGELWVAYTVILRKPKFFTGRGLAISRDYFVGQPPFTTSLLLGTTLLKAQQNNIGCQIVQTLNQWQIVFPAAFSGLVEIKMLWEGASIIITNAIAPTFAGNVTPVDDQYASDDAGGNTAPYYLVSNIPTDADGVDQVFMIAHVNVSSATGGVDNKFTFFRPSISWSAYNQSSLEISEYNGGFSYKANNLGSSLAPVLVNASGQTILP